MSKSQVNFRLPDTLIAALKERSETERKTVTEIAIDLMETGLGLVPSSAIQPRIAGIEERISPQLAGIQTQLEQRIEERITECISVQLEPLQEDLKQVDQRIESRIQLAIQKEVDTILGECSA